MALRRASQYGDNILDYIPEGITLLPNTSGSKTAEEAVRTPDFQRALRQ